MPRNSLTAAQIVRTAIELLDEEGLDGLNMRSLGQRLDAGATSVYWHVESKDNLIRLATDEVWQEIPLPDLDTTDWRTAATELATGLHAMMTKHPWLVQALASHLLYGPAKCRFDEHTLAIYELAGLADEQADQAAAAVFTYVLGNTIPAAATVSLRRRLRQQGGDPDQLLTEATAQAVAIANEFPRLRRRIDQAAATSYNASPDQTFQLGLNALLDGLVGRLDSAKPGFQ